MGCGASRDGQSVHPAEVASLNIFLYINSFEERRKER